MDTAFSTPVLVSTEGRQRSVRGLGEPNLARMYSPRERHARRFLIHGLRECVAQNDGEHFEPRLPLWCFYGAEAFGRIEAKRPSLEGRRFWEHFLDGAYPEDDPTVASIPGIQARHVYEARLSRLALMDTLLDIAKEAVADCQRGYGNWDFLEFIPAIYPYSARAWEPFTIAELTQEAALALHAKMYLNSPILFETVAERMIFQFATELHRFNLTALGMELPHYNLDEVMLDNADFLLLFDPAWDGIEDDAIQVEAGLEISGPLAWFGIETYEAIVSQIRED